MIKQNQSSSMMESLFNPSSKLYFPLRIFFLFSLGLAIYYQTFFYGFVYDDNMFIVNSIFIKDLSKMHDLWITFPKTRLIGMYSFALNYAINQLNPKGYHIFNFIIHMITIGLVWGLTRVIFRISGWFSSDIRFREEQAFIVALLFLVHPCQTQAIAYISQRFESMAAMFYFGSILFYILGRTSSVRISQILYLSGSVICAFGGILTKETPATIPLMVFAVEWILLRKYSLNFKKFESRKLIYSLIFLGIVFLLGFLEIVKYKLISVLIFVDPSGSHDGEIITCGKYLLTQMRVFLTFIRILILPIHQNLDYDYPLSTGLFSPPMTFVGLCSIVTLFYLVLKLRQQYPVIAFGISWVLITFSINMAPRIFVIFEHKLYLISFGFFLSFVCYLSMVIKNRRIWLFIFIVVVALLSLASLKRNQVWKDDVALWSDVVLKSPNKSSPYCNLGVGFSNRGDLAKALSNFNRAIALNSNFFEAYNGRGVVYEKLRNNRLALWDFNKSIALNPAFPSAYVNRAEIYFSQGQWALAEADFNKAITLNPNYADAYYDRGCYYDQQGKVDKAITDYNKTINLNPGYTKAYMNRAIIYAYQGQYNRAVNDINKAIEGYPNDAGAYNDRGGFYFNAGEYILAMRDFKKAIELNPNFSSASNNLYVVYKTLEQKLFHSGV